MTGGCVTLAKQDGNLIGISIGGGAPLCPCLYIVQVFDNTPAAKDGTLEAGDELIGVNGTHVKVSSGFGFFNSKRPLRGKRRLRLRR